MLLCPLYKKFQKRQVWRLILKFCHFLFSGIIAERGLRSSRLLHTIYFCNWVTFVASKWKVIRKSQEEKARASLHVLNHYYFYWLCIIFGYRSTHTEERIPGSATQSNINTFSTFCIRLQEWQPYLCSVIKSEKLVNRRSSLRYSLIINK